MKEIYAIGDSNSIFFHNSLKIKEHWLGFSNLPVTLYRLINEKLDLFNIGNILGNGHEKYNIKENDIVLFFYGYNDIQKNIYNYHKLDYKKELDNLIQKYIIYIYIYIYELQNTKKIIPIISCIYPNPLSENNSITGTRNDRKKYTIYANNLLKKLCLEKNILFFDIYDIISDDNGNILQKYTLDNIHLDYSNIYLKEKIDNYIINDLVSNNNLW